MLAALRNFLNKEGVTFDGSNVRRLYAEDLLEIKGAISDGTRDIYSDLVRSKSGIQMETTGSLPAASSSLRGRLFVVRGSTDVADKIAICLKKSDNTYAWIDILEAP